MKVTPNYILPQLDGDDFFDREALNDGFSKIDTAISDVQESINLLEPTSIKYVRELGDKITKSEEVLKKNEDMILNGGLATKGEIAVINSSLETNVTEVDNLKNIKMNKGESIGIPQIDKNSGKFDQTYMSDEFIQQIVGGTPINSIPARDSIVRGNMSRGAITPDLLSFVTKSNNILNYNDSTKGYTISGTTGELTVSANNSVTEFVYIKQNQQYISFNVGRSSFYNQAGGFISSTTSTTFTTPANAYFARFVYPTSKFETTQVNEGNVLLPYDSYKFSLKGNSQNGVYIQPSPKSVDKEVLKENSVEPNSTTFLIQGNNIFNKNDVILNKRIDTDGTIVDDEAYILSDYIRTNPLTIYSKGVGYSIVVGCYDINKNFLKRFNNSATTETFTTTANCEFIRLACTKIAQPNLMVNKGTTTLPYEDYKYTLKSTNKHPIEIDKSLIGNANNIQDDVVTPQNSSVWFSAENLTDYYKAIPVPGKGETNGFSYVVSETSYNDFIAKWRELAQANPNYITETFLGKDCTNTYDMYSYSLKNDNYDIRTNADNADLIKKYPKIILVAGVHGEEKLAPYSVYWLVKDMIENWQTDSFLEYLRFNINFEIIPVANPSGFMSGFSGTRKNANGVDIARNFDNGWTLTEPSLSTYGGVAPFTEVEAQYMRDLVLANLDAIYYVDYHMNGSSGTTWDNMFWTGLYKAGIKYYPNIVGASKTTLSKCTRTWTIDKGYQLDNNTYSYINIEPYGATSTKYVGELGVPSCTAECAKKLPTETSQGSGLMTTLCKEFIGNMLLNLIKTFKENPLK